MTPKLENNMRSLTLTGLALGLALASAGCATGGKPTTKNAGNDEARDMLGGDDHSTISKAGADQLIPKEKKRAISADARADFEKAMQRYVAARKAGRYVSSMSCLETCTSIECREGSGPLCTA